LLIVLAAYSVHSLIEAFQLLGSNYQLFAKSYFIVSAFGLMLSYSFYQMKVKHAVIGGIYGIAMVASFGTWMIGEVFESIVYMNANSIEIIENISSVVMASFGIFLIGRYLWLRSAVTIPSKYLEN